MNALFAAPAGHRAHKAALVITESLQVMMSVNLVGYGMGQEGVMDMLKQLAASWHTGVGLLVAFFCATHLMFELRRREKERML